MRHCAHFDVILKFLAKPEISSSAEGSRGLPLSCVYAGSFLGGAGTFILAANTGFDYFLLNLTYTVFVCEFLWSLSSNSNIPVAFIKSLSFLNP